MLNKIREYARQYKEIEEDKEFNNIFKELEKDITSIEDERKKSLINILKLYTIAICITILLIGIQQIINISPLINLVFIITIAILIFNNISKFLIEKEVYIGAYKSKILLKLIQKINNDEINISKNGISINHYLEAGFEGGTYNEFKSSDYVGINIKDNIIHLSNIDLNMKQIINNKKVTNTIFKGIYSYIPINKKIDRIYIKKTLKNLITQKGQITIDNENFERYFNIFSTNRILTMRILTPQVMEKMMEFVKKCFIDFEFIIQDNKVHFKFYTDLITPPLYWGFNNNNRIKNNKRFIFYYYCIFKFIIELTEYLSNTINELDI